MAARYDLDCDQVVTLKRNFAMKDGAGNVIPLTGLTARMQVKKVGATKALLTFDSTISSALIVDESNGTVRMALPTNVTAALPAGDYLYDLLLINSSYSPPDVDKLLEGEFNVRPTVTTLAP